MRNILIFSAIVLLSSCFLLKDFTTKKFNYNPQNQAAVMPIIVPRGYVKNEVIDTAGIRMDNYYYANGAVLYVANVPDTTVELQPVNSAVHQPLQHRLGGTVYKGQDEKELFYREIRQGTLRFGYRFVSSIQEYYFDSATNHASLQKRY